MIFFFIHSIQWRPTFGLSVGTNCCPQPPQTKIFWGGNHDRYELFRVETKISLRDKTVWKFFIDLPAICCVIFLNLFPLFAIFGFWRKQKPNESRDHCDCFLRPSTHMWNQKSRPFSSKPIDKNCKQINRLTKEKQFFKGDVLSANLNLPPFFFQIFFAVKTECQRV